MKCNNCGFEHGEQFRYCPNCGTDASPTQPEREATPAEPVSINPAADRVMCMLKDSLFLVLCILMTVASGLSLINGDIALINILLAIFLWLTYSESRKGFVSENHLRNLSGTVYANYVIMNVLSGILAFCGVILGAVFTFIAGADEVEEMLAEMLTELDLSFASAQASSASMVIGWIIGLVFIVVAVFILILNILGYRKIHRLAKSVYQGIMYGNPNFENPRGAKNWIMFFGVCLGITAVSSLISGEFVEALSTGCSAAATIIASILVNKYLV